MSRTVHLALGPHDAAVRTSVGGVLVHEGRIAYRSSPWGLSRWIDAEDGGAYVVGSGALAGAADLLGTVTGPDDLLPTTVLVDPGHPVEADVVVAPRPGTLLAGHQLGFAAGPWARHRGDGVTVFARRTLPDDVTPLLGESRRALDWMLEWFGDPAPWGTDYAQVLVPEAPWLAMEHPGCVLLSERLLTTTADRRVAVVAHEAAHQWLGNLVPPRTWADLGVFEGLAELLGQLACRALLGTDADRYLEHRRRSAPLADVPGVDVRTLAATAGLTEVAGPIQHAVLFHRVRTDLGPRVFQRRIRSLVRRRTSVPTSVDDVWAALGVEPRQPTRVRLPGPPGARRGARPGEWTGGLRALADVDPATAVVEARRAFRGAGGRRVLEALDALADPSLDPAVRVGLAAELAIGTVQRNFPE
ncbi:MAG TPA: M1 family aminopeptidase [Nocardioides sp.]|uniref:M1 family aminopeptidase n=1 Tax=Nocardioides sp. TaxID=35761 RepID=UPI002ED771AC